MATNELTVHEAERPIASQHARRPSKPGFSTDEAEELLGMCVVANYLGPVVFAPFPPGLTPTADPSNPLPNDDGRTYPYPRMPIWPQGWTPGVPSDDPGKPWQNSVLTSRLPNGLGVNGVIVSYNAERNAYAVAFAGTLNSGASMEDICGVVLPAGPVNLPQFQFQSGENYITPFSATPVPPAGGLISSSYPEPPDQIPGVHFGYRFALETMTVGPMQPANLKTILEGLPGEEIDLYTTGHSLGASVAQLFSAWIKAGAIPSKKINVKCYSFATPKCSNPTMSLNYNLALSNHGFSYNVNNSLDAAQQLPPTLDAPTDLINPIMSTELSADADPDGPYSSLPLAPLVRIILSANAPPKPSTTHSPAPLLLPFPLSVVGDVLQTLSGLTAPRVSSPPAAEGGDAPSSPPRNFVAMGTPHALQAQPPVVYNGAAYPPEFFPARAPDDLVAITDVTTRQWWQHWPYNYAKYLRDAK